MAIHRSGSIINNRYEVVQGPHEKPSLAGGMGLVYLCVDHGKDGRPVALKTFRPEYLPNREARDRFLREGTTWVQLGRHPHIVRCHEVIKGAVGSEVFFVLDLVAPAEGKRDASLRSWLISGKPLPVEQALLFALHLARGMKHATEKLPGLVHRDLKPENVLVGRDGLARITDFGLASAIQETGDQLPVADAKESEESGLGRTQLTQGVVGTPLYMAPEQWTGGELDARSDIYAYGCILFEMLAGKRVVSGNTIAEIEKAHREGRVAEISFRLLDHLGQLLQGCVKVNREERYSNWLELESEVAEAWKVVMGKEAPAAPDSSPDLPARPGRSGGPAERVAAGGSYNAMGASYFDIGKFSVARDYFEKALAIGRQEGERSLQAVALGNLGNAYWGLGDTHSAIGYHEQSLAIAREIGDRQGEGHSLGNLGNAYFLSGDVQSAIGYFEQCLAITRHIDDHQGEGVVLGNLGNAYRRLGDARRAVGYYEQRLAISREIGDRHGEGQALGDLGNAYSQLGDARRAIVYHKQSLAIAREIGDRRGEGATLGNLGTTYNQLGDVRGAIGYIEQSLAIDREIGDRHGEGNTLGNLGGAYCQLGDARGAIDYFEQSLAIAREIGDRHGEGVALGNLGSAYLQLDDARGAIGYFEQSLAIARETGARQSEGQTLCNLGVAYRRLGYTQRAIESYERSLAILREIGDVMSDASISLNLAYLYSEQGSFWEARPHAQYAQQVFSQAGHAKYAARARQLLQEIEQQMK
ncbi:MAG: hypothetical protein CV087_16035 [Candidatus Brocadia sp. WS118]|nr:MAG: hypothetical protein CV087_16035 [Candidatus Brocadia sp. WS118]